MHNRTWSYQGKKAFSEAFVVVHKNQKIATQLLCIYKILFL